MKKVLLIIGLVASSVLTSYAQKFALIDMEYILKNIPAYEMANEQLSSISRRWQSEVEALQLEAQNMYRAYQADIVFLSQEMRMKRETAIIEKEKEAQELRRKYFGQDGELFRRRESLIKPIQDEIYNAVKQISEEKGYAVIADRASASSIIFASLKIDVSNEVLAKLGYSK
ncbi:MAG: OmpH family outer membrane protein [Dysgonamonadaceae bacterium]|jgi:outer membrane protein|nr:OmpH family outer membrane protein [Dysgonamonadaceae bacterium]